MKSLGYFLQRRCFLNIQIVLVKVGACVLERKNLIASPLTSPLKTLLEWEEAVCGSTYRRCVGVRTGGVWEYRSTTQSYSLHEATCLYTHCHTLHTPHTTHSLTPHTRPHTTQYTHCLTLYTPPHTIHTTSHYVYNDKWYYFVFFPKNYQVHTFRRLEQ